MFNIIKEDDTLIKELGIEGKFVFHVKGGFEVNTKSHTEACKKAFAEYVTSLQKSNKRLGKEALTIQVIGAGLNSLYFEIGCDLKEVDPGHPELSVLLPNWNAFLINLIKASPKISLRFEVYAGVYLVSGDLKPWQIIRYREEGQRPLFFTYVPLMGPVDQGGSWDFAKPAFEEGVFIYHKASQTDCCIVECMDEESYRKANEGYSPYKKYWKRPHEKFFKYTSGFTEHGSVEFKERPYLSSHCFTGSLSAEFGLAYYSYWMGEHEQSASGKLESNSSAPETIPWYVCDPNVQVPYYYLNWKKVKKSDFLAAISKNDKKAFEAAASIFGDGASDCVWRRFFRNDICARLPSFYAFICNGFSKQYAAKGICPPLLAEVSPSIECDVVAIEEDPQPHSYFFNTHIKTLIIGKNVHNIPDLCFAGCINLYEVKGGESLDSIGVGAFRNCVSLKRFEPSKIKRIAEYAFACCESLEPFVQKEIEFIGKNAFMGCKPAKMFFIPNQRSCGGCAGLLVDSLYLADEFELDEGCQRLEISSNVKEIHFPKAFVRTGHIISSLSIAVFSNLKPNVFVNHSDENIHLYGWFGTIHIGPTVSFVACNHCESIDLNEGNRYLKIADDGLYSCEEEHPTLLARLNQ